MFASKIRTRLSLAALLGLVTIAAPVRAQTSGANGTHDPSRMLESNGKVYVYSTGGGTMVSSDGLVWATGTAPSWNRNLLANNEGIWAPDGIYLNGQYYLYYAMYAANKSSAIGLITSPTLDPSSASYKWTDQGAVVTGPAGSTFSMIDPCPVLDAQGNLWLSWGGGYPFSTSANSIWLTRLDNTTGLPLTSDPSYKPPASPGYPLEQGHKEGSYVYYHNGYYYLFWQTGSCCSGTASTYEINMARATAITGPYTDDRIFYASNGDVHGPGQIGIYSCGGVERFTYHYYPTAESVLGENELTWSTDNWPVAGPPATTSLNLPCAETTPPEGDASTSIPDAGSDANTSTEPTDATSTSSGDAAPEGPDGSVSTVSSDGGQADGTTTKSGTGSEAGSAPASGGDGGAENTGNSSGWRVQDGRRLFESGWVRGPDRLDRSRACGETAPSCGSCAGRAQVLRRRHEDFLVAAPREFGPDGGLDALDLDLDQGHDVLPDSPPDSLVAFATTPIPRKRVGKAMGDVDASLHELSDLLGELETLLKNPDVGSALAERGVNVSLALVATNGLRAYLTGDKKVAAEDFDTVAEEIATRLELARDFARSKPS